MTEKKASTITELFLDTLNTQKKVNPLRKIQDIFGQLNKLEGAVQRTTIFLDLLKRKELSHRQSVCFQALLVFLPNQLSLD